MPPSTKSDGSDPSSSDVRLQWRPWPHICAREDVPQTFALFGGCRERYAEARGLVSPFPPAQSWLASLALNPWHRPS